VTVHVAAALTALEGLAFAAYGVALLPALFEGRPEAGSTSLIFFLVYAVLLAVCAWQLWRLRSWARAPVVLAQLIQLLVGTSFWGGSTTSVALVLIGVAVAVLVALLHPKSLAALGSG
jgi:ABC-type proline/glycine betaine transport system permease subunit